MKKIMTPHGLLPVYWPIFAMTHREPTANGVVWITNYRVLGVWSVREDRREAPRLMMTTVGEMPSNLLNLVLEHKETPCGLGITACFYSEGEEIKREVRMEVYTVGSTKGEA